MVWAAFCFSAEINLMQHATMPCEGPADLQLPQGLGLLNGIFELVKYRLGGHAASFRLAATRHLVEQKRAVDRWGVKASPQHSHVTLSGGASTDAFSSDPPRCTGGAEEAIGFAEGRRGNICYIGRASPYDHSTEGLRRKSKCQNTHSRCGARFLGSLPPSAQL
jgi:hypothetical protein